MAKANAVVSLVKDPATETVTVTVAGHPAIVVRYNDLNPECARQAIVHGIGQKLVDAGALSRDPTTGKPADAAAKYAAIREVADALIAGQWNVEREGGGASSMLFEALCLMLADQTPESIRATLDGLTDAEKRELPFDPEIAPFYKQVRDARNAKKAVGVDSKAVLARFKA